MSASFHYEQDVLIAVRNSYDAHRYRAANIGRRCQNGARLYFAYLLLMNLFCFMSFLVAISLSEADARFVSYHEYNETETRHTCRGELSLKEKFLLSSSPS